MEHGRPSGGFRRWADLRRGLEVGSNWRSTDRVRAVRLRGQEPRHAAGDDRVLMIALACHARDPTGPDALVEPLADAVGAEKRKFRIESVLPRHPVDG